MIAAGNKPGRLISLLQRASEERRDRTRGDEVGTLVSRQPGPRRNGHREESSVNSAFGVAEVSVSSLDDVHLCIFQNVVVRTDEADPFHALKVEPVIEGCMTGIIGVSPAMR